jgi:hypothetical protein
VLSETLSAALSETLKSEKTSRKGFRLQASGLSRVFQQEQELKC